MPTQLKSPATFITSKVAARAAMIQGLQNAHPDLLLDANAVGALLDRPADSIRVSYCQGYLPIPSVKVGRSRRWRLADVLEYIAKNRA